MVFIILSNFRISSLTLKKDLLSLSKLFIENSVAPPTINLLKLMCCITSKPDMRFSQFPAHVGCFYLTRGIYFEV